MEFQTEDITRSALSSSAGVTLQPNASEQLIPSPHSKKMAMPSHKHGLTRQSGKVLYFEWLRCIAAAMVVLIHVTSGIMDNYSIADVGVARALVWSEIQIAFTRWCVPAFLMVTGALLLNPDRHIGWQKVWIYVRRMLLVLCTFGFAFCLMKELFKYRVVNLAMFGDSIIDLLSNNGFSHMWYVYALIGVYLLLPLFKDFVNMSSKRDLEILLVVFFCLTCIVPTINAAFGLRLVSFVWITSTVFYVFLGYYAHTFLILDRRLAAVGIVALVVNMALKAFGIIQYENYFKFLHGPACPMEALWALMVFLLFKRFFNRPYGGGVATLSNLSFGIYILHPLFINILYKGFHLMPWDYPPVLYEVVVWVIAFFGSIVVVWLCKRTPFLKSFI